MRKEIKLFSLLFLFFLQGCTLWDYFNPPEREIEPPRGNKEEARELVQSFMQARIAGESEDYIRAFLTQEAWSDYRGNGFILKTTNSQELVGYKIMKESELSEGKFAFTVLVQEADLEPVEAQNIQEDIIVRYSNEEYRISSARFIEKTVIQAKEEEVMWRGRDENGQEKEEILVNLRDLPTKLVPIGGTEEQEFGVGLNGYSGMALFPNNKGVAFGTTGGHSMIVTMKWEDTPLAGDNKAELNPIDLIFNGSTGLMAVSPDSKYLAVEAGEASGSHTVRLYQTADRNRLDLGLNEAFPQGKYDVKYNRWEPDSGGIVLRVNAAQGATGVDQNKLGTWVINIKTGEREKIVS